MRKQPSTRVMEVFGEAIATPPARRDAFLELACHDDPSLRAEVQSLLETQEQLGEFLDQPTVESEQLAEKWPDAGHADSIDRTPALVGPYHILERLGEGGFGVVYRARQDRPIQREVALKLIKLGMDSRQILARFDSERQALALMDHPNIARIYDAGTAADGRPFFAMELVSGRPLTEHCDLRQLSVRDRLELFLAVCQAVQHAHQKGIIHRDIKPSNILVTDVDGAAAPKVIDFGIAKAIAADSGPHTTMTELRHVLGTPQYMSPEQAGANKRDIDTRTDIYSLGILLYELLTGATPFDAKTLEEASNHDIARAVAELDPRRPSLRLSTMGPILDYAAARRGVDPKKLRRMLAGELDWIVMKAIEKDRRRRYESAGAFADDIRRYLSNEPVTAGRPSTWYRTRKFTRRYRRGLLVVASLTLTLMVGLAGTTIGFIRAKRDRDSAQRDRDNAAAALAESRQVSAFLSNMLTFASPDQSKGSQVLVRDVLDRTSAAIARGNLKNQPLVEAGIRSTLGRAYDTLGMFPQAEEQLRAALATRTRLLGMQARETNRNMADLARAMSNRAEYDDAEHLARLALSNQEKYLGADDADVPNTLITLGLILRSKGDRSGAEAAQRRAVELNKKRSPRSANTAVAMTDLGVIYMDKGDWDNAEVLLRDALAIDRELFGDKFRNVPRNLSNLAAIRDARHDEKGAEEYWLEALRIQREMLPAQHQDTAWTLRLLGKLKHRQNQLPAAEGYLRESLEMERKVYGPKHPIVIDILEDLAAVMLAQKRYDEDVVYRREAVEVRAIRAAAQLAAHPELATNQGLMAHLLLRAGHFQEARGHMARASELQPDNVHLLTMRTLLDRYLQNESGYSQACQQILKLSGTAKGDFALHAAEACLLGPTNEAQRAMIAKMVPKPLPAGNHQDYFCIGLSDLAAGNNAIAAMHFIEARRAMPGPLCTQSGYFLAIALHRDGKDAQAQAALDAANLSLKDVAAADCGDLGSNYEDWLICQIALHQARLELPNFFQNPPAAHAN